MFKNSPDDDDLILMEDPPLSSHEFYQVIEENINQNQFKNLPSMMIASAEHTNMMMQSKSNTSET